MAKAHKPEQMSVVFASLGEHGLDKPSPTVPDATPIIKRFPGGALQEVHPEVLGKPFQEDEAVELLNHAPQTWVLEQSAEEKYQRIRNKERPQVTVVRSAILCLFDPIARSEECDGTIEVWCDDHGQPAAREAQPV